ncbi:MAG TPA: GAF domain-containing sensor histidine kinase [Methylomirabilota bacterium]|jgi:PAS domain S-box-containing protein|nr:GAF domain-containing sensor histidine kinase [Methylomirabilota bacterium]
MRETERLTRLSEILIELVRSPIPTHFFQVLADEAGAVVPHDYLAVCLEDEEKGGYLVHPLSALDGPGPALRVFSTHEGLPGRVMREGRAAVVTDLLAGDEAVFDLEGALREAGMQNALVVPIRRGLEVLGALLFAARGTQAYGDEDVRVATLMASGLSAALETSQAYQAASDERSTLAAMLASTDDAVLMINQSGVVLLANAAVRPMLGLAPDALTGRPLLEVVDYVPIRQLFAVGRPGTSELSLPDGRTAQASLVPVTTPFGEPVGLAAILRDISVLKNLEQMKNDFVNTVSHDLKNPITVIGGFAELMLRAGPGDPKYRERCEDIRDTARHMGELVSDLLDLGKIEAGLDPYREPTDLVPLIGEALKRVMPHAERKRITLQADLPGEAWVSVVPTRIRQALINIIDNGVKYTPEGGRVTAAAVFSAGSADAGTVTVRVTDTGIGIPARSLPHVFDKFYRVQSAATRGIAGTGLGLAITKSIVEAHDGRIRVESVEGSGTTFVLELPLHRA